jgi:hypothetical protein
VSGSAAAGVYTNRRREKGQHLATGETHATGRRIMIRLQYCLLATAGLLTLTTPLSKLNALDALQGPPRHDLILFARGDQNSINPATTATLRAGNLVDRTVHYRHDLAVAEDPTIPKNPHSFIILPTNPNALVRSIAQGVQRQIAAFFASGGTLVIHPEPAEFFEVPFVEPLPERLNYIR